MNRVDRELPVHLACRELLLAGLPRPAAATVWHTPNENTHKVQFREKLRKMGLLPGVEDLSFVLDGEYYAVEVKAQTGRQSPEQQSREAKLWHAGGRYALVHSADELKEALTNWGIRLRIRS